MTPVRAKNHDDYVAEVSPLSGDTRDGGVSQAKGPDEFTKAQPSPLPTGDIATTHPYFSEAQTEKTLSAVLDQIMTEELSAIVNKYPEDSADYFFAKDVAVLIQKKIQEAYTLNYFPTTAGSVDPDFSDLLEEYYDAPVSNQVISVVMRRQPHFGELGSVDTLGILTETQLKKLDKLYKADTQAYLAMKKSDAAKAKATKQTLDYTWASHVYSSRLVAGPISPQLPSGELPLELEYKSTGIFELLNDQEFLDSILSLNKKYNLLPSHTKEILSAFGTVITNTNAYWQRACFGIDLQLYVQTLELYTPPNTNSDLIEVHPNTREDWMAQIPSLDQLAATSLYLSERRNEVVTESIKARAIKTSGTSVENQKLFSDLSQVQKDFIAEFGPLFPKESLPEMASESERWLISAYQTAIYEFPVGMFNSVVTSFFEFVDTMPDGFSRELFCEVGQWLLRSIVSCLESNQISFSTMIEREFGAHDEFRHEARNMLKTYADLLWNAQALVELYANGTTPHEFSKDIAENAAITTLQAQSPYNRDVTATLESLSTVLATSVEIIMDRSDYETCVRALPIFASLTTDLSPATLITDFLAGTQPAAQLYAGIYERQEFSLPSLQTLYQILLANYPVLESQSKAIYPQDAEFIHRARVALYYIKDKIEIDKSKIELVQTKTVAEFAADSLGEFKDLLPFGWPLADGSTPDGRKLDLNLFPDENLYLSWQEFSSFFLPTSRLSDEEIATKIKLFFGDWNQGYFRYFGYGGFASNSQEFSVSYFDESVVLKRLMVLFANIIEFAQARASLVPEMSDNEATHQEKIIRILSDSAPFLKSQFESPTFNPDYFALMNNEGEYTGIVPKYTDRETTPLVLDTESTLWRAKHQSQDLVDISYASFTVAAPLAARPHLNVDNEFELFENVLRAATPIDRTSHDEDYITTLGPAEAQYLLGRLFLRSLAHDNHDQLEKVQRLKYMLATLSRSFVETIVMDIESSQFLDYQDWHVIAGYPTALASFLAELSPAEKLWVYGYLKLRLILNDRFDKNTDSPQFEFLRQDKVDAYIDELDAFEAFAVLQKISELYELHLPSDEEELSAYTENPNIIVKINDSMAQSPEFSQRASDRAKADKLFVSLNENYGPQSFSDLERLYMLCLVDEKLNGNTNAVRILSAGPVIDVGRVNAFVADFPQNEQQRLYIFLYNLCYYHYTNRGDRFFLDSAGATSELFVSSDNAYWDFVNEELAHKAPSGEAAFSLEDFDDFELNAIYFAWQNLKITPPLPRPEESYSAEYALILNKILVDENFYGDNQEFFEAALTDRKLESEYLSNVDLLILISPLLSLKDQQRHRLKERHDKVLAKAVEWDADSGSTKIDPYSEIVLGHVYREAPVLNSIITAPYNEEDLTEASLYSRFDAHAYSQGMPAPQELAVIYSRDYFAAQMFVDDPRLLRQVSIVLTGILHLIESEADGQQIESWVDENSDYAAVFGEIVKALDKYGFEQTLAYYQFHNFNKVEATRVRLELLRCDLSLAAVGVVAVAEKTKEPDYGYVQ